MIHSHFSDKWDKAAMAVLFNCGYSREIILSGTLKYQFLPKCQRWNNILIDFKSRFEDLPEFAYSSDSQLKVKFQEYAQFIQKKKVNYFISFVAISSISSLITR